MSKELEALEKINHTLCLNSHRIEFGVDEDSIDCKNIEEFVECYNTIRKYLTAHKNIEEELGIDLITLFKALTDGIWYKNRTGKIEYFTPTYALTIILNYEGISNSWTLNLCSTWTQDFEFKYRVFVKDYGKTWSLTKEELL